MRELLRLRDSVPGREQYSGCRKGSGVDSAIHALAADTDGIDGTEDNAGAFYAPDTLARAQPLGLDLRARLADNDGYGVFEALGDLLVTGPTLTNVNDFRAILVLPPGDRPRS